jgi:pilin isopeptide linkage protein
MPGTYKYRIVEEKENNSNYEYDNSVYDLTYEVMQEEDHLVCERTFLRNGQEQLDEQVYFMNKYTAPVSPDNYENPRTGDNIYVYVIMLVISSFGLVVSTIEDKRRKKEEVK